MQRKVEAIKKLTALWYRCLVDHHKDRDCHFYVEHVFSYGGEDKWRISHYGYVADDWVYEFKSQEAAYNALIERLKEQIRDEAGSCYARVDDPEYDILKDKAYWRGILDELEAIG